MSRSLGSLSINLIALTGKFEANFKTAANALERFGLTARKIGSIATGAIAKMGGAFGSIAKAALSVQGIVTGLIAIIGGARLVGAFDAAADAVDNLGKKSRIVGLSIEQMSVLRLAAGESGVEFETLTKLVGKATKNIGTFAMTGGGPAADAIGRLGLNIRSSTGGIRNINELLPEIAKAFESIADEGERLSLSEAIFGREGGTQFVQWIEDSGGFMANLAEQTKRANDLGVMFTETQFAKLKAYRDAVGRVSEAWLGLRVRLMTEIAPALTTILDNFALSTAKVGKWVANLFSVIRAAVNKEDMVTTTISVATNAKGQKEIIRAKVAEPFNYAFDTLKGLVSSAFGVVYAEISTRIRYLFARVWETIRLSMVDLFTDFGAWLTDGMEEAGSMIGDLLGEVAKKLGEGLKFIAGKLSEAGAFVSNKWEEAGTRLMEYENDLKDERSFARDVLAAHIDDIARLGEEYRNARDKADGYGGAVNKLAGAGAAVASNWDQFFAGMKESWKELSAEANNFAQLGRDVFGNFARNLSTGLSSALASGEASFKNFGQTALGVLADVAKGIAEMLLQFLFMRAITGAFGGLFAAPAATAGGYQIPALGAPVPPTYAAHGGAFAFANGGVASGVMNGPAAFPFSKKVGIAGEAGAEAAFAPLRMIGGELGVKSIGGETTVQIIDQRGSGARPEVSSQRGDDGRKVIRIMIRDEVRRGVGEGDFDKVFSSSFGLGRKGTKR